MNDENSSFEMKAWELLETVHSVAVSKREMHYSCCLMERRHDKL